MALPTTTSSHRQDDRSVNWNMSVECPLTTKHTADDQSKAKREVQNAVSGADGCQRRGVPSDAPKWTTRGTAESTTMPTTSPRAVPGGGAVFLGMGLGSRVAYGFVCGVPLLAQHVKERKVMKTWVSTWTAKFLTQPKPHIAQVMCVRRSQVATPGWDTGPDSREQRGVHNSTDKNFPQMKKADLKLVKRA